MSVLSLVLPTIGSPDSTEDPKINTAFTAIQTWANGNIDGSNWSSAAWSAYTPTWTGSVTNPVIGNGTLLGAYMALGKTVHFRVWLLFGSTTTFGSGAYTWALPVPTVGDGSSQVIPGFANAPGGPQFYGVVAYCAPGSASVFEVTSPNSGSSLWGSANGFNVAGSSLVVEGIYQSA